MTSSLDQCEMVSFPFKKKLLLENLSLAYAHLPIEDLVDKPLGNLSHELSLAGNNRVATILDSLVISFPKLKNLDLINCDKMPFPEKRLLPHLKRLNLSQNRLTEFLDEICCHLSCFFVTF